MLIGLEQVLLSFFKCVLSTTNILVIAARNDKEIPVKYLQNAINGTNDIYHQIASSANGAGSKNYSVKSKSWSYNNSTKAPVS